MLSSDQRQLFQEIQNVAKHSPLNSLCPEMLQYVAKKQNSDRLNKADALKLLQFYLSFNLNLSFPCTLLNFRVKYMSTEVTISQMPKLIIIFTLDNLLFTKPKTPFLNQTASNKEKLNWHSLFLGSSHCNQCTRISTLLLNCL